MNGDEAFLEELRRQEEEIQFTSFSNETALAVGLALLKEANKRSKPVAIDITRGGQQLFHFAMAGTAIDNGEWIKRKNRVVNRFGHSSYYMGMTYASKNTTIQESSLLDPTRYAAHGGAFPVIIKGVGVVGTITVSGLPQQEDHQLVVRVLADYLGVSLEA